MIIVNQLLQNSLLICMRIQQSIAIIISKASTSIVRSAISFVLRSFCAETGLAFYGADRLIDFYMEQTFSEKFVCSHLF